MDWDSNLVKMENLDMVKIHIPDPLGRKITHMACPNVSVFCTKDFASREDMYIAAKNFLHHQGKLIWEKRWDEVKLLHYGSHTTALFKRMSGISYSIRPVYCKGGSIRSTLTITAQLMVDRCNSKRRYCFGMRSTIPLSEVYAKLIQWMDEQIDLGGIPPKGYELKE